MPAVTGSSKQPIYGETIIASSNTWQQLSTTAYSCAKVLISAPSALNTKGSANAGNILIKVGTLNAAGAAYTAPANQSGGWTLQPTQNGISYELCSNASGIWIFGTAGDGVEYSIYG